MHVINGTLRHGAEVILVLLTLLNLLLELVGGRVGPDTRHWLPLGANAERANAAIRCDCVARRRLLLRELAGDLIGVAAAASTLIKMLLLLAATVDCV